jgi:glutaminyl-tRNA synthetase
MNNDLSSYFEDPEFKDILAKYEGMVENPRDEMAAIRDAKNCDALEAMKEMINPDSLKVLTECYVEKFLADAKPLDYLQFQRIGYFNVDKESTPDHLVFNRTVSLKDTWSKINK